MTGNNELSKTTVDALKIPPDTRQQVIEFHFQIWRRWTAVTLDCTSRQPPFVRDLEKYGHLEPMKDLTVVAFITLLKVLARKNPQYLIPNIMFEAIIPDYYGNELSLPGLGLQLFQQAGQGLFDVLQRLLPTANPLITEYISAVSARDGNGFILLWDIGMQTILIFKQTITIDHPTWPESDCIYTFKERVKFWAELNRFKGNTLHAHNISTMFLENVI